MSCFLPLAIQSKVRHSTASFLHYFRGHKRMLHTSSMTLKIPPPQYWAHQYLAELYLQGQAQAQSFDFSSQTSGVHVGVPPQTGELWSSFPSRSLGPWLMLLIARLHICSDAAAWENSRKGYRFFLYASFLLSQDLWKRKKWSWPVFLPLETNQHLD